MRDIRISAAMNGYIIKVGCQTLVFESADILLNNLAEYLADPHGVEEEFVKEYGMKGHTGTGVDAPSVTNGGQLYTTHDFLGEQ